MNFKKELNYTIVNLILSLILLYLAYNFLLFFKEILTIIIFVIFFSFIIKYFITVIDNFKKSYPKVGKILNFSKDFIILILISFFILFFIVIILILAPTLYSSIKELALNMTEFIKTFLFLLTKYSNIVKTNLGIENLNLEQIYQNVINEINNYIPNIANLILNIFLNSTSIMGKTILVGILTFYFVRDYDKITDFYLKIFTKDETQKEKIVKIINGVEETISKFIIGQFFAALYIFIFILLILSILKVKNGVVIALIAGFFELIPFIGAFIGFTLSTIFIIPLGLEKLIIFLIYITVIYQLLAKFIYPKIVGTILDISIITVLLSLLIGYKLAGVIGMFISIPLASIIKKIITNKM